MNRKDKIEALVKKVSEMDYGETISFYEIGCVIEDNHGTKTFNNVVQAAKRELISMGHMLENVRCVGYKVVSPDNYTRHGVKLVRSGAGRIDEGVNVMRHAPVDKMTAEAREAHNRVYDNMMNLQASMAGACVQIHMLEKKRQHPLLGMK